MAIKAKIKATATGPLFLDFPPVSLARSRVFGRNYPHKKFQKFLMSLNAKTAGVRTKRERVVPFFQHFFILRPLFSIANVNIFKIFFLNMIDMAFYRNMSKFAAKFHITI